MVAVLIVTAVTCFLLGLSIVRMLVGSPSENQPVLEGENDGQPSTE